MYSIDSDVTNEYVINKSKFITKLYYVDNVEEVASVLNKVKSEYSLANHYCYAYIINNISKSSDDKEPSGTAGIPILNVLLKNNLNNILCIVVRYSGGIKLGAGGLVRAYTNSVSSALINHIVKYNEGYKIRITFNYDEINKINYLLKDVNVVYKEYNDNIIYECLILKDKYESIKKELNSSIIESCYIKDTI